MKRARTKFVPVDPGMVELILDPRMSEADDEYDPRGKLLAHEDARGYGGEEEWPFWFWKAVAVGGYRTGIRRAVRNPFYAANWRYAANIWLEWVDRIVDAQKAVEESSVSLQVAESRLAELVWAVTRKPANWLEGGTVLPFVKEGLKDYIEPYHGS